MKSGGGSRHRGATKKSKGKAKEEKAAHQDSSSEMQDPVLDWMPNTMKLGQIEQFVRDGFLLEWDNNHYKCALTDIFPSK